MTVFLTCQSEASDWTHWDSLRSGDTKIAVGKFAPDQKLQILFTEKSGSSTSAPLEVILATFSLGNFSFRTVARIGPTTTDEREQDLRLVGDSYSTWAIWRNKPSSGPAQIQAAKIYPRPENFAIEVIDSGSSEARFDAVMGADGQPRIAFLTSGKKSVTMCRRASTGFWEKKEVQTIANNISTRYEELALATQGNNIALVLCTVEPLTGTISKSQLWSRWTPEPEQWFRLTLNSPELLKERNENGDFASYTSLKAVWNDEGALYVTTLRAQKFTSSLSMINTQGPGNSEQTMILGEFSRFANPDIELTPSGSPRFAICDQFAGTTRVHYIPEADPRGDTQGISDSDATSVDMELDSLGNPWFITRHPNENLLQISTLTDVTDLDGDGIPALLESALLMDPAVADAELFPKMETITVDGRIYPAFTFRSQSGGTGSNPYRSPDYIYSLEISDNLETWSTSSADLILSDRFTITGRGSIHIFRSTTPINRGEYFRIRVKRK